MAALTFLDIPPELTFDIFSRLETPDLVRATGVSRGWRERALDPALWTDFGGNARELVGYFSGNLPTPRVCSAVLDVSDTQFLDEALRASPLLAQRVLACVTDLSISGDAWDDGAQSVLQFFYASEAVDILDFEMPASSLIGGFPNIRELSCGDIDVDVATLRTHWPRLVKLRGRLPIRHARLRFPADLPFESLQVSVADGRQGDESTAPVAALIAVCPGLRALALTSAQALRPLIGANSTLPQTLEDLTMFGAGPMIEDLRAYDWPRLAKLLFYGHHSHDAIPAEGQFSLSPETFASLFTLKTPRLTEVMLLIETRLPARGAGATAGAAAAVGPTYLLRDMRGLLRRLPSLQRLNLHLRGQRYEAHATLLSTLVDTCEYVFGPTMPEESTFESWRALWEAQLHTRGIVETEVTPEAAPDANGDSWGATSGVWGGDDGTSGGWGGDDKGDITGARMLPPGKELQPEDFDEFSEAIEAKKGKPALRQTSTIVAGRWDGWRVLISATAYHEDGLAVMTGAPNTVAAVEVELERCTWPRELP